MVNDLSLSLLLDIKVLKINIQCTDHKGDVLWLSKGFIMDKLVFKERSTFCLLNKTGQ